MIWHITGNVTDKFYADLWTT